MIINNSHYALVGYFITSYPTRAHGIIVIYCVLTMFSFALKIKYSDKNLKSLENVVNAELQKLYIWLTSNKLNLNIKKSNLSYFALTRKKLPFNQKYVYLTMRRI